MIHVQDASHKLLPFLSGDDVTPVVHDTESLQAEQAALQEEVTEALVVTEQRLEARRKHAELEHELQQWMEEVEKQLAANCQPAAELAEKRAQQDCLKVGRLLHSDVFLPMLQ